VIATQPTEEAYGEQGVDLRLWRKLLSYALVRKGRVIGLAVFAVGVALADTAFPLLTRELIDDVDSRGMAVDVAPYALAYLGLTALLALCVWGFILLAGRIRTSVSHDIRRDGFENLQRLSFSYFDHRPVGWLMARMTSDCDRLSNILAWGVLDLIWGVTTMTAVAAVLLAMDLELALVVLAVIPLLVWACAFFQKRILESSRVVRRTNSRLTASYNEGIMGVRTSKVFVRERESLDEFSGLSDEMLRASVRNALQSALFLPLVLTLGSLATGLALAVGGLEVTGGRLTIGTLIAFMTYTRHFFEPIQEMSRWFAEMQMAQASAERIIGLIEAEPEIADSEPVRRAIEVRRGQPSDAGVAEDGGAHRIGDIRFHGVGFTYRDGPTVLEGFDLEVRAGETVALVGSTGGGKSTILSLLCRFYEPTEGRILLDGLDYRERSLHWLQSNLGIVLQTPHLFSGSVADNIRYGRLEASEEEIAEAARLANADEFIHAMGDGYATEVGEGGNRLSIGQKQLVSFARAILARPQILVMDEATSSVDTETERRIQQGLSRVIEGRTSFVIAHRLSTIRSADRILVIEDGRIVEQGNHADLLALRGRYCELYTQQSLRESARSEESWAEA